MRQDNTKPTQTAHERFHDRMIEQALPAWLSKATPAQVDTLRQSMQASLNAQRALRTLLANLKPMDSFCAPLLQEALFTRLGDGLDSDTDRFIATRKEPVLTSVPIGVPVTDIVETRMSLFEAALHNFSPDQTTSEGLIAGTRLMTSRVDPPTALDFIACCRATDLGGAYQVHLKSVLKPADEIGDTDGRAAQRVISTFASSACEAMYVDAQLALLKGDLSGHDFHVVEQACTFKPLKEPSGTAVQAHRLKLLGVQMSDIVVFDLADGRVIACLPGNPGRAVQAFASLRGFANALEHRLRDPQYQGFFSRYVPRTGYSRFFGTLRGRFDTTTALANVGLDERLLTLDSPLFDSLARERINRILEDAAVVAVPTATLDRKAALEHARCMKAEGLTLLNLAGLFVPGLGEVMLGVAVFQLMGEVYHGVKDWHDGDIDEALGHLFNVAANVALMGATVAGVVAIRTAFARSTYVDSLLPADMEDGRTKLWNLDLTPWQQALPGPLMADATGMYRVGALRWVNIDGGFYPVRAILGSDRWQLPPANGLAPMLAHNGAGAWRILAEDPLQWSNPHYLFRRLGEAYAHFDGLSIDRILEVTGIDTARLRQWHVESVPADANLQDTCTRFALDARIERFVRRLEAGDLPARGSDELFEPLMDALPDASAQELAQAIRAQRPALFETGYQQTQVSDDARVLLLRRDFASLTLAACRELIAAHAAESAQMSAQGRIPLRMAELARAHIRETRITRALEGRYLHTRFTGMLPAASAIDRDQVPALLGLPNTELRVRWPTRLPSGRWGYPLSGRGEGMPRSLANRVREIYPGLSDDEVDVWVSQSLDEEGLDARLATLREHFRLLDGALHGWVLEVSGSQVLQRQLRRQVARTIEDAWRRRSTRVFDVTGGLLGYRLNISNVEPGGLPSLPMSITFTHICELLISNMGLAEIPDSFIRSFTQLRMLELPGNRLRRLPAHLDRCSALTTLDLHDNFITLDLQQSAMLGRLTSLETLDLSGNPIGPSLDLRPLTRLNDLYLRRTLIDRLPTGLLEQPLLVLADLRDNQITQLPERYFLAPRWVRRAIVLDNNPLEATIEQRMNDLMEEPLISMVIAQSSTELSNARLGWLARSDSQELAERKLTWDLLQAESGSTAFFSLLIELQGAADFTRHRTDLTRRVFGLLEAMRLNAGLRSEMFEQAAAPRTCHDSVALIFSGLEVRRQVWLAQASAEQGGQGVALLQLARRLFRLDEVERIAAADVLARQEVGLSPDEIEVSLAYRIGLREPLDLPGQPLSMLFNEIAGVSAEQLSNARRQVIAAERTDQLMTSISQRDFWVDYLQARHRETFEATDAPFHDQAAMLMENQTTLADSDYQAQMNAIADHRRAAREALILRLTHKALSAAVG
ncbi:NEL-type E3 ubiquitin ligase domain-containing protein [Pseudomonas sp. R5(2019)]|uniref:NEL-type E3 ubiquitin ligase domain-containing protein n=1 Tax=Pseudomonas sp. R5(2019) TaxID=2697566 RepID=UPI0014120EEB|nr:NEL-type E3 ubiquitin ligase domain-containing protein [Pseudomonas sp. R5(2019)]NBA97691.1 hypothetical protein [Pseudomonas sp. R5(2019)]